MTSRFPPPRAARYKALGAGCRACARRTCGGQPGRLGERRRRLRGARGRSVPWRTVSGPRAAAAVAGRGGRTAAEDPAVCTPAPAGGSLARVCAWLACFYFSYLYFYVAGFLFFLLGSRRVGWFLGVRRLSPGAGMRLVRAQPGEPGPCGKVCASRGGRGAGCARGAVPLSVSQLEPWLVAAGKTP